MTESTATKWKMHLCAPLQSITPALTLQLLTACGKQEGDEGIRCNRAWTWAVVAHSRLSRWSRLVWTLSERHCKASWQSNGVWGDPPTVPVSTCFLCIPPVWARYAATGLLWSDYYRIYYLLCLLLVWFASQLCYAMLAIGKLAPIMSKSLHRQRIISRLD